ncbi:3-oxoacyl-ACP synthase III family protein [Nocardia sp. NPDC056064]|uniref:3-oxoacyl-ACP synthase III family protein n=1 Tax=Nocardia sp. NPDC056064 TaxID=3345701 RepID=UPI0035E06220
MAKEATNTRAEGSRRIGVIGTGRYLPEKVLANADIAEAAGVSADWILERTGVLERRVAASDQAASDLATEAVRDALDSAGLSADQLDLIVLTTSTPDELGPSTACRVQNLLGAPQSVALDVSAACSGWIFGARVAADWLTADHRARYAAVVGVEVYSRFLDRGDRATAVLFGDGAAATILGPVGPEVGFGPITLGADGRLADDVLIRGGGSRIPATHASLDAGLHLIHMDGRAVRDFILDIFPRAAAIALNSVGLAAERIDLLVTHQPNPALVRALAAEAGFEADRMVVIGDRVGNIGAGSTPYALATAHAEGRLHEGDRILIVGFGAGATWGSTVLTWGTGSGAAA